MFKHLLIVVLGLFALNANASGEACLGKDIDILEKIKCLPSVVSVTEVKDLDENLSSSIRQFEIQFLQNVDHADPTQGTFQQKLVLLHRSEAEPMVLQTSGYMIFGVAEEAVTKMFETNQLQIEHRFFLDSSPKEKDWTKLNIKQSADDFHNITVAFKKIYQGKWVNTGTSKGGMTSTYHRFFYPDDLDGTLANVAPLSFSRIDQRYSMFLRHVGGDKYKACREGLKDLQVKLLADREKYLPRIEGNFSHVGGREIAFEHATMQIPFLFWQYGNPENKETGCEAIPKSNDPDEIFSFFEGMNLVRRFKDEILGLFTPYFYQSATELGGPDVLADHLEPLRLFEFGVETYAPKGVELPYSNASMRAVSEWVQTEAKDILFIYGSFDPWTATEYELGQNTKVHKYYVEGGNHGVKYTDLAAADKAKAIEHLSEWLNKEPVSMLETQSGQRTATKTLSDIEYELKQTVGL